MLTGSGSARSWPCSRGIFYNSEYQLFCWVNEEDHLRVISMQKGSKIG